jgi:hypothetical protein
VARGTRDDKAEGPPPETTQLSPTKPTRHTFYSTEAKRLWFRRMGWHALAVELSSSSARGGTASVPPYELRASITYVLRAVWPLGYLVRNT